MFLFFLAPFDMSCPQKTSSRAKKKSTNLKFTEQPLVAEIAKALQLPSGRTSQGNPSKGTKVSRFNFFSNTTMTGWKITYFFTSQTFFSVVFFGIFIPMNNRLILQSMDSTMCKSILVMDTISPPCAFFFRTSFLGTKVLSKVQLGFWLKFFHATKNCDQCTFDVLQGDS